MNPEELSRSGTEHGEQMALFAWANMAQLCGFEMANNMESYSRFQKIGNIYPVPELKWLHAIPNAGARGNLIARSQLKAEGVKAGIADIFLPVHRDLRSFGFDIKEFNGLYIELKRANGKMSDISPEQREFGQFVKTQGYEWFAAFGWREAAQLIQTYLTR